jgi:hypothetical protein
MHLPPFASAASIAPLARIAGAAGLLLALGGCGDDGDGCPVGDPSQPLTIELVQWSQGQAVALVEGGTIDLIYPPQGGYVILPSVRAGNVDGCTVELNASLRDTETNRILGLEQRPINLATGADGLAGPAQEAELSDYANVASCPNAGLSRDMNGNSYRLNVRITDRTGRQAEKAIMVTPDCGGVEECDCMCDVDYVLGVDCASDGGVPDGGVPDGGGSDAGPVDAAALDAQAAAPGPGEAG